MLSVGAVQVNLRSVLVVDKVLGVVVEVGVVGVVLCFLTWSKHRNSNKNRGIVIVIVIKTGGSDQTDNT